MLESAIANAEHNEGADVDELKVSTIFVDEGMTMKRIRPRAKGRADRIFKRSCHITVKVAEVELGSGDHVMGQKVHPTGIRLGIVKKHSSTWYAGNKDYADKLNQDLAVRAFIQKKLSHASVSRIDIERPAQTAHESLFTRPVRVL